MTFSKLGCVRLSCALVLGLAVGGCSDDDSKAPVPHGDTDSGPDDADSGTKADAATDSGTAADSGSGTVITEADCLEAATAAGTTIGDAERMMCVDGVTDALCGEAASCICDKCICLLGACEGNPNCLGLRTCAQATGCRDMACFITNLLNPACSGLTTWGLDQEAVDTLTGLGACLDNGGCNDVTCGGADGGADDGG